MTSAKVRISVQDRSAIVPVTDGVYAGVVIRSNKGPINEPTLITSENEFVRVFGDPDPSLGVSQYSAITYLQEGNKLWVVRSGVVDTMNSRLLPSYSCALVRSGVIGYTSGTFSGNLNSIIHPISGVVDPANYGFSTYATNKLYEHVAGVGVDGYTANSDRVRVNSFGNIVVGDVIGIADIGAVSLSAYLTSLNAESGVDANTGENTEDYVVRELNTVSNNYQTITVTGNINAALERGDEIRRVSGGNVIPYLGAPTLEFDAAAGETTFYVSSSDYFNTGDELAFFRGSPATRIDQSDTIIYSSKSTANRNVLNLVFDRLLTSVSAALVSDGANFFRVTQSDVEHRDAFLVYSANQGTWGDSVSVGITDNNNYDNAFNIVVYSGGVEVESWEVTRTHELDGFGNQLYLEDKINGKSSYIRVRDNVDNVDSLNNPSLPLVPSLSYWQRLSERAFVSASDTLLRLSESVVNGNSVIHVQNNFTGVIDGSEIKIFYTNDAGENLSTGVYTVSSVSTLNGEITIVGTDGVSLSSDIPVSVSIGGVTYYSEVRFYNSGFSGTYDLGVNPGAGGHGEGVAENGNRVFPVESSSILYKNVRVGGSLNIGGFDGTLLDGGSNLLAGGSLGSGDTVGDLVNSYSLLGNRENTKLTLLMDGGWTFPAVASEIARICGVHGLCHGYLSVSASSELGSSGVNSAIVDYKNSLNLNTHLVSIFSGWVRVFDKYSQRYLWVSPEGYAAGSQSFTTREYQPWYPAAGWDRGRVRALDVRVKFSEGDRDYLVDNRVNPLRFSEGSGISIWGNETLLSRPSPLQLRSVSMLLIVIREGLEGLLEYRTFELNNERTWSLVEGSITAFMRDNIQAKGGVVEFQVSVSDIITDSDIDNRVMPVFLGIKPTSDIRLIDAKISIFNSGLEITV